MKQQNKIGLLAAAIVVGGVMVIGMTVGGVILAKSFAGYSPSVSEKDDINIRQLADYLKSRKVIQATHSEMALVSHGRPSLGYFKDGKLDLCIVHFDDDKTAKDWDGIVPTPDSFRWGRFIVAGEKATIGSAKKALSAK